MKERAPLPEPIKPSISAHRFVPNEAAWNSARSDLMNLASSAIAERIIEGTDSETWCKGIFANPHTRTTSIVLRNGEKIIGFATATPAINMLGLPDKTAEIYTVIIDQEYRGQGYVGKLMDAMGENLREEGYTQMQGMFRTENGFAAATDRHYGERVMLKTIPEEYQFLIIAL